MNAPAKARDAHAVRTGTAVSPCCGAKLLWKVLCGIRVFREDRGQRIYGVRCSKCRRGHELDGGPV